MANEHVHPAFGAILSTISTISNTSGGKVSDIPEGFNGVYRCKNHPEREVTVPIALRMCEECLSAALSRYSSERGRPPIRYQDELSTDGRNILADHKGEYKKRDGQ